jgi:acetate kinase
MTNGILVINAGSTSVKFAAYRCGGVVSPDLICRGEVEGIVDVVLLRCSTATAMMRSSE